MKLEFPILARYVWPVLLVVLMVDLGTAAVAAYTLHRAAGRAHAFMMDGLQCYSYAPHLGASFYVLARCTKEELK